jgi:hypothetical protein
VHHLHLVAIRLTHRQDHVTADVSRALFANMVKKAHVSAERARTAERLRSVSPLQHTGWHTEMPCRYPYEAKCDPSSLAVQCAAYVNAYYQELTQAYQQEVQRNAQYVQAYGLLFAQHERLAHDFAALANQHRSLQKELTEMQTEALAHSAVVQGYEQRLASQPPNPRQQNLDTSKMLLVARVGELEREKLDMRRALVSASELLVASRKQRDTGRAFGSGF